MSKNKMLADAKNVKAGLEGGVNVPTAFQDMGFQPNFENFTGERKDASLSWTNVGLRIGDKQILQGITGQVAAGEVCALMGPSGAGKTSLLNILAGRIVPSKKKQISGQVFVNNQQINPKAFQNNIAYVMQEDLLYATATAREALEFSAKLRLSSEVSRDQAKVNLIVDDLLESLGLTHVQNTRIGSERVRGLSGGEKKRVAIGVEVVTNPTLLFLDEPTSGLDSVAAWKVVKILQALGNTTGCSIICTIHQPSSEIFNAFDKVMMLARGGVMYNGPVNELSAVLGDLGRPIPENTNPADFLLLVAQTSAEERLPRHNVDADINPLAVQDKKDNDRFDGSKRGVGIISQILILAKREGLDVIRDFPTLLISMFISGFLGLLYGLIFLNAADREAVDEFNFFNAQGVVALVTISIMFGSAEGPLLTFPLERGIFLREYRTGSYSAASYFLAKLLVEIPKALIGPVVTVGVSYFLLDFQSRIFMLILIGWALSITIASYAILLGSIVTDAEKAQQFATLILVPQLLFSGIFASIDIIPSYLSWVQYVCVLKYALNLVFIEEFNNCEFEQEELDTLPGIAENCTAFFEANDIDRDLQYRDILVILAVFVVVRTLSVIVLAWRSKRIE